MSKSQIELNSTLEQNSWLFVKNRCLGFLNSKVQQSWHSRELGMTYFSWSGPPIPEISNMSWTTVDQVIIDKNHSEKQGGWFYEKWLAAATKTIITSWWQPRLSKALWYCTKVYKTNSPKVHYSRVSNSRTKMSHSIHMLSIQIDTKSISSTTSNCPSMQATWNGVW